MKKYLKLSAMCLLASAMAVFSSSCKDEDHGVADPVLGMEIDLGEEADEELSIAATVDQVAKVINVTCNKSADLSKASCKFKLADGAFIYSPFKANPVVLDLNEETGVVVQTGDKFVYYKIVTEVDYALRSMTASAGGVEGAVTIDQSKRVIDIYFNDANADLSNVSVELELSPNATPIEPASTSATMNLTADTTMLKVNMLGSEMVYKIATWSDLKGDENLRINASGVSLEKDAEGTYKLTVEGSSPMFWTQMFQSTYSGYMLSFEYKASAEVELPKIYLDAKDKNVSMYGGTSYGLSATEEWKTYTLDMRSILDAANKELPGYSVTFELSGAEAGSTFEIRNVQIRERNAEEKAKYDGALKLIWGNQGDREGGNNNMSTMDITQNPDLRTYQFNATSASDPYAFSVGNEFTWDNTWNQFYFEYKSEVEFGGEIYFVGAPDYNVGFGQTFPASPDTWTAVHIDWTDGIKQLFERKPDAGNAGNKPRMDFDGLKGAATIIIRNPRLEQK